MVRRMVMPRITAEQYWESPRKLHLVVYMAGKPQENEAGDPIIRSSMNEVAFTHEMAHQSEHEGIMTAIPTFEITKPCFSLAQVFDNLYEPPYKTALRGL